MNEITRSRTLIELNKVLTKAKLSYSIERTFVISFGLFIASLCTTYLVKFTFDFRFPLLAICVLYYILIMVRDLIKSKKVLAETIKVLSALEIEIKNIQK